MGERPVTEVPEELIYDASREHIAWQTIGIFDEKTGAVGTGTGLKVDGQAMIITAGHVLQGMKLENMRFTLRSDNEPITGTPLTNRFRIIKKEVEAIKLPVIKSQESRADHDLGFILLDNTKLEKTPLIFLDKSDIAEQVPVDLEVAILSGFPEQLIQSAKRGKIVHMSVGLYIDYPRIIPNPGNLADYDPSIHFLLRFPEEEVSDKKTMLTRLRGMSGASARQIVKNVPGKLWQIKTKIIGIQTGVYRESRTYKCTRSEILLKELDRLFGK